ncbi:MAG TPA: hypothetical protein VE173_12805, partial [Longimicrobiales bacterium]|nr:hypothetical protein [Longimicrobiales bacterium]
RAHELEWPGHVVVVAHRTPSRIPVTRAGTTVGWVTAAGHETGRETTDLSGSFPRPPGELPEVALLHTQVRTARGAREHEPYAPSVLEHLRRSGFDYWALGHVHTRQALSTDPPIHYPGNLQGRTPRETGPRGGLLVDLENRDDPRVEFRAFAPIRWETLEVEGLEDAHTLEALVSRVRRAWDAERSSDAGPAAADWIVRVRLRGPTPLWRVLARSEERRVLADELGATLDALDVVVEAPAVHPVVPVEEHRAREDVLGEALRLVSLVRSGHEPPPPHLDLVGPEEDEEFREDGYVRSLLEDAEGEILARLLRGED